VQITNQDPRRRPGHSSILTQIRLDDAAHLVLRQQNMQEDSIPALGQKVKLRTNCNLSTGGTATDVTDEVHPGNAQMAELAAQILALDVAGIDILCEDISRPLQEQNGAVVEVNAAPGLRMHLHPVSGQPRDVGTPIVEMLYPGNAPSRIPIIAVTGTNGKTTVTRLISHMYETAHWVVGMTSTDGTYINSERIMTGDCSGPRSAQAILLHPRVEVAVLETARGGILREGLAFDSCSVGVVTNISSDHLGLGGINTLEELARVKQVVVESVRKDGAAVLNADDPLVAEMAASTDSRVVYFSQNSNNHIITAHLLDGGWAVFVRDNAIVLATSEAQIDLLELDRVPFTANGKIQFQVANALAATAAAWAAGLNPAMIARALTTFRTDYAMTPGRFNLMEANGIQIILDYGHNTAAMKALMEAADAVGKRHTLLMVGLPGDRRNEDLIATIRTTIPYIDKYILYDLEDKRGRETGEIPNLLRQQLPENKACEIVANEYEAIHKTWAQAQPGDRMIIIADLVDESIQTLHNLISSLEEDATCTLPLSQNAVIER
jgi:cyanophycin synthetase